MKITFVVALSLLLAWFAWNCFPTPLGDSRVFMPPCIAVARGDGLVNHFDQMLTLDPTGQDRWFHYPPLFPEIVGHLMPHATAQSAIRTLGFLGMVAFIMTAWLWRARPWSWLLVGALATRATHLSYMSGSRTETLAAMIVTAALILGRKSWPFLWGLLALCHPAGAALALMIWGCV